MPRYNKATNPTASVNVSDFRSGTTVSRVTGQTVGTTGRTTAAQVSTTASAFGVSLAGGDVVGNASTISGRTWSYVAWVYSGVTRTVRHYLSLYNGTSFVATQGTATDVSVPAGTWVKIRGTVAVSNNSTYTALHIHLDLPASGTASTLRLSAIRIEQVSDNTMEFADGDTGGQWSWDGTAGVSSSTMSDAIAIAATMAATCSMSPAGTLERQTVAAMTVTASMLAAAQQTSSILSVMQAFAAMALAGTREVVVGSGNRYNRTPNPYAKNTLTGWTRGFGSAGTVTRVTGLSGPWEKSTGVTITGDGSTGVRDVAPPVWNPGTDLSGQTYSVSVQWGVSYSTAVYVYILFFDASGTLLSYPVVTIPAGSVTANVPQRTTVTATAPTNTTRVGLLARVIDMPLNATFTLTAARYDQTSENPLLYADGDTLGWAWDGSSGDSSSRQLQGASMVASAALSLAGTTVPGGLVQMVASSSLLVGPATGDAQIAASLAAKATLSAAARQTFAVADALAAKGSLTASALQTMLVADALAAKASLVATGRYDAVAVDALAASATMLLAASQEHFISNPMTASAQMSMSATMVKLITDVMAVKGSLTANALRTAVQQAVMKASPQLYLTSTRVVLATDPLKASASFLLAVRLFEPVVNTATIDLTADVVFRERVVDLEAVADIVVRLDVDRIDQDTEVLTIDVSTYASLNVPQRLTTIIRRATEDVIESSTSGSGTVDDVSTPPPTFGRTFFKMRQ